MEQRVISSSEHSSEAGVASCTDGPGVKKKKHRGRPAEGHFDARQALIEAGKLRFSKHSYDRVTTRLLAEDAGVNVGLIKYYFLNKEGLYKAMFRDFIDTVACEIKSQVDANAFDGFESFFRIHAGLMMQYPEFPLLLQKEIIGEGKCREYLTELVKSHIHPHFDRALQQLKEKGLVHKDADTTLIRISALSLMFFPFLSRYGLENAEGFELNQDNVERLVKHNARLIESGCFVVKN